MFELLSLFLFTVHNVHTLIVEPHKLCAKSSTVSGPCHLCECSDKGIFRCNAITECRNETVVISEKECESEIIYNYKEIYCTCNLHGQWRSKNCRQTFRVMEVQKNPKYIARSNYKYDFQDSEKNLPEIKEGQTCEPGKSYKMSCNTCRCGENNALVCTKMACFYSDQVKQFQEIINRKRKPREITSTLDKRNEQKQVNLRENKMKEEILFIDETIHNIENDNTKLKGKDQLREGFKKNKTPGKSKQKLLVDGKCSPGKVYEKDCQKCFCTYQKKVICVTKCDAIKLSHQLIGDAVILEMAKFDDVRQLPHTGSECEPGKVYRVDCNTCWCTDRGDLSICTYKYCLDTKSYMNKESKNLSGKKCKKSFTTNCIKCNCVNKRTKCKSIPNCQPMEGKQVLLGSSEDVKLTLDVTENKCIPNMTYRVHCNTCRCLQNRTLICTSKMCLTNSLAKSLQKKYDYLEENGL